MLVSYVFFIRGLNLRNPSIIFYFLIFKFEGMRDSPSYSVNDVANILKVYKLSLKS